MQQNVAYINKKPQTVCCKKYRIEAVNGVGENHKRTNGADNPKSERQEGIFSPFRINPLVNKTKGKNDLSGRTPNHKQKRDIFVFQNGTEVMGAAKHQPANVA